VIQVEVMEELERRRRLWAEFRSQTGSATPATVKRLKIHIGQQGVFRDLERTRGLSGLAAGIAVGVLHTGRVYGDDLNEHGLVYHYPNTVRGRRDANEIASIKACLNLALPLFVVITPYKGAPVRDVRLSWVVDYDDRAGLFLIAFGEDNQCFAQNASEVPFSLFEARPIRRTQAKTRPNQWRFRFDVMKRYGPNCAVCPICDSNLLEAAHLCPVEDGGSDDPRNGLVFCLNHHRAFDRGLLRINPHDLSVSAPEALATTRSSIRYLPQLPHPEALMWTWQKGLSGQDLALAS
jgi:putative restriction endonuclease